MDDKKKVIKFEDVKQSLIEELQKRSDKIGITESVTLLEGFVSEPFSKEYSNTYVLGGPMVPMIMLIGNESGRIYFFALKAILKNIEL